MKNLKIIALALTMCSCVSPSNESNYKRVEGNQRLYVGRILVNLNGQAPSNCELHLDGDMIPTVKLSADGYLILRSEKDSLALGQLICLHKGSPFKAAWHSQKIPLGAIVHPKTHTQVTYFGDLVLNYTIDPEKTKHAPIMESVPGPQKIGHAKDSGKISVSVEDQTESIKTYAEKNWPILQGREIETHIVKAIE